jgi:hypothetical protein
VVGLPILILPAMAGLAGSVCGEVEKPRFSEKVSEGKAG